MPKLRPDHAARRQEAGLGKDHSEALARGLQIMATFDGTRRAQTLSEVAATVGLPRATARRALLTLVALGYVALDGRRFHLTPRVLRLATAYLTSNAVSTLLQPACDRIAAAVGESCHVLGIPAGCKIHSGVYGVTPAASGRVAARMIAGELLSLVDAEVMDIDEEAFRAGKVRARHYGQLLVPGDLRYVQAVKQGGRESEELVLADLAAGVVEQMEPDTLYLMGSGSTVAACMGELGLENTLLGVDLVENGRLIGQDLSAAEILTRIRGRRCRLIITLIGGQGHLFGRGNQQLSPDVIRAVGREHIQVLATKAKLAALEGRPLLVDTDDPALNRSLSGYLRITTGYKDQVIYPVANPE